MSPPLAELHIFPKIILRLNHLLPTILIYPQDCSFISKEEVDKMVSNIMSNVKYYVEKTCAGAKKIIQDEAENTERLVRRTFEDGKATLEEKTAQISQRNAAVDKLNDIKDKALRIGRDCGIGF